MIKVLKSKASLCLKTKELLLSSLRSYFLMALLQHFLIPTEEMNPQITGKYTKYKIQRVKYSFQIKGLSEKTVH